MFTPQTNQHSTVRRVAIIVGIVIAVALVGLGVALFLRNLNGKFSSTETANNQPTAVASATTANTIISDYISLTTVHALAGNYQIQQDSSASSYITLRGDSETYTTSVPTTSYALFYASNAKEPDDSQAVLSQTTSFMSNRSFAKVDNPPDIQSLPGQTVTTYSYLGSVCQLTSSPTTVPEFYTIACVNKSDITKQYNSIQTLLALYEKNHPLPTFTRATASTTTSGDKSMTTISLNVANSHPLLLFAAVGGDWQYLGDLSTGAASNGKYALPPDVQTAIHNPKYGDFLTHNLQD